MVTCEGTVVNYFSYLALSIYRAIIFVSTIANWCIYWWRFPRIFLLWLSIIVFMFLVLPWRCFCWRSCGGSSFEENAYQAGLKNIWTNIIFCPNIIKQIPKRIEKCLSQFSSNEEIFNESAPFYEEKLHQSGYQQKLNYNPANIKTHWKRYHKRNII